MTKYLKEYCKTVKPRYRKAYSEPLEVITQDKAQAVLLKARHTQENCFVYKHYTSKGLVYRIVFVNLTLEG